VRRARGSLEESEVNYFAAGKTSWLTLPPRASQRGGRVHLFSCQSFAKTLATAEGRIDTVIASKLESFFELAEYNWMPARPQSTTSDPSTYVFEMITFLTAYVDSVLIGLNEAIKTRAYQTALTRINKWMMVSCHSVLS